MQQFITRFFYSHLQGLELLFIAYRRYKRKDKLMARQLFDKFKSGMERHIEQEEQCLLPELELVSHEQAVFDKARREHQQIRQQMNWIESLLDRQVDSSEDDQTLEYLLSDHFENDEFGLYPTCDRLLDTDATTRVLMAVY
ncbi:hemerythrin domain-containing protein [Bowmanella dokdonensis]|uniref:Hemerythrin domain-containing protein n=1 Tax=Bowmanella dokdonensis TaxID=751969 RepID=A0A939DKS8_9ALTE|nr:hemerythrin domain-containing protein [Bowmanella dokdonensis]MBN7824318.1 hemerythrin domain-containing protein [Bowmanella dokdonensis]